MNLSAFDDLTLQIQNAETTESISSQNNKSSSEQIRTLRQDKSESKESNINQSSNVNNIEIFTRRVLGKKVKNATDTDKNSENICADDQYIFTLAKNSNQEIEIKSKISHNLRVGFLDMSIIFNFNSKLETTKKSMLLPN